MKTLAILGAGGHGKVVADAVIVKDTEPSLIVIDNPTKSLEGN